MKICSICKNKKTIDDFYRRSLSFDGLQSHCKSCDNKKKKSWKERNPDKVKEQEKKFRKAHPENFKNWINKNPERFYAIQSRYRKNNKEKFNARTALRFARKHKATPLWANKFFIDEIYDLASRRTKLKSLGIEKWQVDHIVPIRSKLVCGLHVEHNLQVIPAAMNLAKGNRFWPDMPL